MISSIDMYSSIFFDFDGVIKDSVSIKTEAYSKLFTCDVETKYLIESHHRKNCGVSRYEKIPLYFRWVFGCDPSDFDVNRYLYKFRESTLDLIIQSPWVNFVREFIEQNAKYAKIDV